MRKPKEIIKKLLFPPIILIVILSIVSVFGLIYSFLYPNAQPIIKYFSYLISAYTLAVLCLKIPNIIRMVKNLKNSNPFINKFINNLKFRLKFSLYVNVILNSLFSAFHLFMGIIYKSIWFYSLFCYYILLSVMRFFLLRDFENDGQIGTTLQWKRFKFCGVVFIAMNIVLSLIVFLSIHQNRGFNLHLIFTITMAAFTFTITTIAIINFVKFRKHNHPLVRAIKFVTLAAALVSMLSLERAMLNTFSTGNNLVFKQIITALTGFCVCLIILSIGIYMVITSSKQLKKG